MDDVSIGGRIYIYDLYIETKWYQHEGVHDVGNGFFVLEISPPTNTEFMSLERLGENM